MPASEASARVTDAYRQRLVLLRDQAVTIVASQWTLVDVDDLNPTFRRWMAASVAVVTAAQREAARLSQAYLASFVSSELGEAVALPPVDAEEFAGVTRDGRPISLPLSAAIASVNLTLAHRRTAPQALASGLLRAVRTTRTEVMEAGRTSLASAMSADERVVGWRRVTAGHACGACLGAATGAIRPGREVPKVHASCRCVAEPVVRDAPDTVKRPTGKQTFDRLPPDEQDRLFAGRGGKAKADLIRSGRASLEDLVTVESHPAWSDTITETPLERLVTA